MNIPPNNQALRTSITKTYLALRWGMAGIGLILPFFLWIVGPWVTSGPLPDSISGYYHTPLRDVFVGALVTTGTFLFLYKIFTPLENWLLNIAGISAILVAVLPCTVPTGRPPAEFTFQAGHVLFAIITFVCLGLTAIFCARKSLMKGKQDLTPGQLKIFTIVYRTIGVLMIALPLAVALLDAAGMANLFWIESAGLWMFSAYWGVKTFEFSITGAEKKAIKGPTCTLPDCPLADRTSEGGEAPHPVAQ
ncbi:Uncharacterised protein [Amycolatopsis camponoti]|uniref:DUF998 domain-containing protein n=1 Tax=Amycolatopsis camponoti TaxID=2606593 RepID=A0A6I8M582_9PSEU|nr:hypothetical protein [Amycolatopsis camponoti]VVJ24483.1 Uncharacterised protein [Amycolatopsis camponoti]